MKIDDVFRGIANDSGALKSVQMYWTYESYAVARAEMN